MATKMQDVEISVFRQSKSSIYHLLDNHKFENQNLPISLNTLLFNERSVEQSYIQELYLQENLKTFSDEFKTTLIYFYTITTVIFISLISFTISLYTSSDFTIAQFAINLSVLLIILGLQYLILYLISFSVKSLLLNKILFTAFAIFVNSYLILCNDKILTNLIDINLTQSNLPLSIVLVVFTCLFRSLIFDDFFYYLIIVMHAMLGFLILNLTYAPVNLNVTLCECAVVSGFMVFQLIESHMNCLRSKLVFWRKYSEEQAAAEVGEGGESETQNFETETERLVYLCDKVKSEIKFAIKAIIFKDVKQKLKDTLTIISKIKNMIGHGSLTLQVPLENHIEDHEDREFVEQNYRHLSVSSSVNEFYRAATFINLAENRVNFSANDYGLQEVSSVLEGIGKNWSFDIWFVFEITGRSISILGRYLFTKYDLTRRFKIADPVLDRYLGALECNYKDNPYHNACHGGDVLHSLIYFCMNSDINKNLKPIEILASIIAALAHDVGHPGVTSRYLIQTRDALAIQFNDISVLESMHCSLIYQYLAKIGHNILEFVDTDDWICCRKIIIEMVLATDMGLHFEILGRFRTRALTLNDLNYEKFEDKLLILSTALKCADIGHSAKYNDLHVKWSKLVMEEFFKQGDLEKEKNLPVSMYCDRTNTNIPKSQAGFLKNICIPLFEVWCKFINTENVNKTLDEMKKNLEYWDYTYRSRRSTHFENKGCIVVDNMR